MNHSTEAKRIVRSECYYPGGRSLERLRDLEVGNYETNDQELHYAVRMAATDALRGDSGPEGGFPGHSEDV